LLGLARVDRPGKARAVLTGVLLLPACLAFAAAVEFAQLYVPVRTCAGSDVFCQGFGAAVGMAGWGLLRPRLTGQARQAVGVGGGGGVGCWGASRGGGALLRALPMALTLGPRDLYKKLRDGLVYIPFGEFRGGADGWIWERAATLVQVTALYLPVGLLAANL